MHFIQNHWFVVYSVWLLLFFVAVVAVIFYINNKNRLFQKSFATCSVLFIVMLFVSFQTKSHFIKNAPLASFSEIKNENKIESSSILNNLFHFASAIFKEKLNN